MKLIELLGLFIGMVTIIFIYFIALVIKLIKNVLDLWTKTKDKVKCWVK